MDEHLTGESPDQIENDPLRLAAFQHAIECDPTPRRDGLAIPLRRVVSVSRSGDDFGFLLIFQAGRLYCCSEVCCHVGAIDARWWQRLRQRYSMVAQCATEPLTCRVVVEVEAGAELQNLEQLGLPRRSDGYRSDTDSWNERDAR